jgi:hypothetical protein
MKSKFLNIKLLFLTTIFLFVIFGLAKISQAATTYYVCDTGSTCGIGWTTGNDSNYCTAKSTPCKTITAAADKVNPGDTVIVGDGIYSTAVYRSSAWEVVYIRHGGTASQPVTIKSEHLWGAKIQGNNNDVNFCVLIDYYDNTGYVHFEDFDISNCARISGGNPSGDVIFVNARANDCSDLHAHDITFYRLKIHDNMQHPTNDFHGQSGIDMDPCTGPILIDSCVFYDIGRPNYYTTPQAVPGGTKAQNEATCTAGNCSPLHTQTECTDNGDCTDGDTCSHTIACYNRDAAIYTRGSGLTVQNCLFYGDFKSGWAMQPYTIWGPIDGFNVINNTFYGGNPERDYQITLAGSHNYNNVLIENNIFYNPRNYALNTQSHATNVTVRNNLVYGASLIGGAGCSDPDYTCLGNITG